MKTLVIDFRMDKSITSQEIEDIIVTALEGGIGYWAMLRNDLPEFKEYIARYPNEPASIITSKMLQDDKTVILQDAEGDELWPLTLNGLIKGLENYWQRGGKADIEDIDADGADSIIQFAVFDKIIFG